MSAVAQRSAGAKRLWPISAQAARAAAPRVPLHAVRGPQPEQTAHAERARMTLDPRRAAPQRAAHWRDSSTRRIKSALAPMGDRPTFSSGEGRT